MWVMVFFDLPVETKKDQRDYRRFVNILEKDGFTRFQYSIFIRHSPSLENAKVHIKRVKINLPPKGHVVILHITDRQFGLMEIFRSTKKEHLPSTPQQLELF
jgi:CRISPR-associated protein Cas2